MPLQVTINYLAVLVAAVASMVLGFLWYGPLFGKAWMKLRNLDEKKLKAAKQKGMGKTYLLAFLTTLIMSYVLAHFVDYVEARTIMDGIVLAFWLWLGFFATMQFSSVLWEGKPVKLYLISTLHYLVALAVMASILVVWV